MEIKKVNIFAAGTWNGHKFIENELDELVSNTKLLIQKRVIKQPSVKLGHSTNQILAGQEDGDPALGVLTNFSVDNGKIFADFVDLPEILFSAIEKGLYKQVSVELRYFEAIGWAITAAAILGADIPAVKTLDDLGQFMSELNNPQVTPENALVFSEPVFNDKLKIEKVKKMDENNSDILKELEALKAENAKLLQDKKSAEFSVKKSDILQKYAEDVKAGKLQPAMLEKIEKNLDSQKENFSEKLNITPDLIDEVIQAYSQKMPAGETAGESQEENDVDYSESFSNAVNKMVLETGKSYIECSDIVAKAAPNLLADYKKFTLEARGDNGL